MLALAQATYIWIDGSQPSQALRSKTKILPHPHNGSLALEDFPKWGFDGSSTYQAEGRNSDLLLKPVCFVHDPILGGDN